MLQSFDKVVKNVNVELVDKHNLDPNIPRLSHTAVENIHTCPTWGIVRYQMYKQVATSARETPLDAGKLAHDVYAAIRLYQLAAVQGRDEIATKRGIELFGADRWAEMCMQLGEKQRLDHLSAMRRVVVAVTSTSGYYDDPYDKKRTLTNIESSCLAYVNTWDVERYPVYVSDDGKLVGAECSFVLLVTFELHNGDVRRCYVSGKIDGLHWNGSRVEVHENKTTGRINDVWQMKWATSHQPTTYMLAAQLMTGMPCQSGFIIGMQIPLAKEAMNSIAWVPQSRHEDQFREWFTWLWHGLDIVTAYKNDPIGAPKFSHSCNRYFRICSLLPFCTETREGQQHMLNELEDRPRIRTEEEQETENDG